MHGGGQGIDGDCGRDGEGRDDRWAKEVFDQALKVAEGIEDADGGQGIEGDCEKRWQRRGFKGCLNKP
jgi:hypothetical protein